MEKSLIFRAITASASPFLGLFGTVWGVMSAFLGIGYKGSAELSVMGIAEALVTTAAGLAIAIPALISCNQNGQAVHGEYIGKTTGHCSHFILRLKIL